MMASQEVNSWTFFGLVIGFLDLAIAYFLLCASTVAFFGSKFLGFFGLCLPYPCNELLFVLPSHKVSSGQFSMKNNFPFDSIGGKDQNYRFNLRLIGDRENKISGIVELEDEDTYSSNSDSRRSQNLITDFVSENELGIKHEVKPGRFDLKGKRVVNQRPRDGHGHGHSRRRRRTGTVSYDPSIADVQEGAAGSSSFKQEEIILENLMPPIDSGGHADDFHYDEAAVAVMREWERDAHDFELDEPQYESKNTENSASSVEEFEAPLQEEHTFDDNGEKTISTLKQALDEERSARAALYLELEKERNAAASAADEAMAMILRLQEEKAAIDIEARQYQRVIEEKSEYDAEAMNILKEILVRRETEMHFLEKEVEAYRQMVYSDDRQFEGGYSDKEDPEGEDPVLMLHKLNKSIDGKEMAEDIEKTHIDDQIVLPYSGFQEKGVITMVQEPNSSKVEIEPRIHDVHVVGGNKRESLSLTGTSKINRSSSDTTTGLPPTGSTRCKTSPSDMRRNSGSSVDSERSKIGTEVGLLIKRLQIVQEGREKLNLSVEHTEREKVQLQLLEDISYQLKKIFYLTGPGSAVRQASLPPPATRIATKKRGRRSSSVGVDPET